MPTVITGTDGINQVQAGAVESGDLPAEAYQKNNILGTVSESSGVPTGAIIERGSNANGEFVKYADGTLMATGIINEIADSSISPDASLDENITYPIAFQSVSYCMANIGDDWTERLGNCRTNFPLGNSSQSFRWRNVASDAINWIEYNIAFFATGRWY